MTNNLTLKGCVKVPGDKSISHRSIMIGSLARGCTRVSNFLRSEDCLATINCFRSLGVTIEEDIPNQSVTIYGNGIYGLCFQPSKINVGNSGTSMRVISGILCGQDFATNLVGDESLNKRPMLRIIQPLLQMNANIRGSNENTTAPLYINNDTIQNKEFRLQEPYKPRLRAIHFYSPIASAQVKSCILFAGIYADGTTTVTEPYLSRNHTEIMLKSFGADIKVSGTTTSIEPAPDLIAQEVAVPGDISSAAFFIVAALIVPNSEVVLKDVGLNPTRDGILEVAKAMGANIKIENYHTVAGEPVGDLIVKSESLHGTVIGGGLIPRLIDELPIIAVLACFADGETIIKDAQELRLKESDRIELMVDNLQRMGADITATDDGMIIRGGKQLHGTYIKTKLDHRIAMAFSIAELMCDGINNYDNVSCVSVSYPDFYKDLDSIIVNKK